MLRVLAALFLAAFVSTAQAYTLTGAKWTSTPVVMQLQLGAPPATLIDGNTTWGAVAESALNEWNAAMANESFSVVRDSTAARASGNRINNVFFSGDIYGDAWGTGVLAVTLSYHSGTSQTEADVLFNTGYAWNSYPGALRTTTSGDTLMDFRRVALHEFGHVLGLDHPDQAGQSVSAVMNSRISNTATLTADDLAGVQSLYGVPAPVVQPPQITGQPQGRTVVAGASTSFTVGATGTSLSYQWLKNGAAISGATSATYTIASVATGDAGTYSVIVSNALGSVTSGGAVLTVTPPVAPPAIVTQPVSQSVTVGDSVSFSVRATGGGTLFYTWFRDGSPLNLSNTASNITLSSVQATQAGVYTVQVFNSAGSVMSAPATLTVRVPHPPVIASVSGGGGVVPGAKFTLSANVTSALPVTYQWSKDGLQISGATSASFTVAAAQPADSGRYTVAVTNADGAVAAEAEVTVTTPVVITRQPVSVTVNVGNAVVFRVEVANPTDPSLSYYWEKDGQTLWDPFNPDSNNTRAEFVVPAARLADAGNYVVRIGNAIGVVESVPAVLTVLPPPTPPAIAAQPAAQNVALGESLALTVNAAGAQSYQWQKNGIAIPGATGSTYAIAAATPDTAGDYTVVLTNAAGSVVSNVATVTMNYSRLANLSARGYVPPGGALTPGFVMRDDQAAKSILIRGVGPTLGDFGVATPLANPKLELIASGASAALEANDDWGGTAPLADAFARVGAFALAATSADAAVTRSMVAGVYTARVTSSDPAASGIALAEIYDTAPLTAKTRLINLSARGFTAPGENVLTAGFVIVGNMPKRVLLRAIGPGLVPYGVTGALADPQLQLVPAGATTPLAENNDWGGTAALKAAFAQVGAFALPDNSTDAALVITLAPGVYTALVTGVGGTSGEALVEVYDLYP